MKVMELKPDFAEAYYTLAVAKETIAYQYINKEPDENGNQPELTLDEISNFNNTAQEAIDAYNEFLVKKVDAEETDAVNAKISELNLKVKELTRIYDERNAQNQEQISMEVEEHTQEEQPAE